MTLPRRRSRALSLAALATLTCGVATAGSTATTAALGAAPTRAAEPVSDCAEPFPVDDIAGGDAVTGLTVTSGTEPTGFSGTVLGVIEDGIAPGLDMVMAELESPELDRTGGIWQGMSGSPVYAEDGRLIGAVAYGLAYGPSPIAGITPFAEMDDYLADGGSDATPGGRVAVRGADAQVVADQAGISRAEALQGFRELPMPLGVNGVSPRRIAQLGSADKGYGRAATYAIGRASAVQAGPESIVAGGNLAASVAYGDISLAGVGTATSVCDGRVVGFGHPLAFLGRTTMSLHPADAVYVQPDPVSAPFKVANLAPPVGTITDDRTTGITGSFGPLPQTLTITSEVTYGERSRTGTSYVSVQDYAPDATFYGLIANQDRVVDGPTNGSQLLTWRIAGEEDGTGFTLRYTDRLAGRDLSAEAGFGVADFVYYLSRLDGVELDSLTAETAVDDDQRVHHLVAVEQRRNGQWVRVTRRDPAVAERGGKVYFRAVVAGPAGREIRNLPGIAVPARAKAPLLLSARGGESSYSFLEGETVAELRRSLAQQLRSDQVRLEPGTPDRLGGGYEDEDFIIILERRGPKRFSFVRTRTSIPLGHVVDGSLQLPVKLR